MTLAQLQQLRNRLAALDAFDHATANALLRDASVFARKVFGEESAQLQSIANVQFRDPQIIYNTGHYKNQENWDAGARQLNSVLESMKYELDLIRSSKNGLAPPERVTLPWLLRHVPLKLWGTTLAILAATFYLGHIAGSTSFFPKLVALVRSAAGTP